MNETLKKILKFLSRSLGFFLINLAVLFLLLIFFVNLSVDDTDTLKKDLESSIQVQILTQSNISESDLKKAREYCNINSSDANCNTLKELDQNQEFNELFDKIKSAKNYFNLIMISALILFLFGFIFVYLGTFSLLITSYKVSVHLTISNFLAALYFKFIPNLVNAAVLSPQVQEIVKDIPKEFIDEVIRIILNWIEKPLFLTIKLTIILGIIFLMISIILFILKRNLEKSKINNTKK